MDSIKIKVAALVLAGALGAGVLTVAVSVVTTTNAAAERARADEALRAQAAAERKGLGQIFSGESGSGPHL
ncbi:MAG: hypothetical protein NVS3B17_24120 [Vulcanimicrobiaceae bacterium]